MSSYRLWPAQLVAGAVVASLATVSRLPEHPRDELDRLSKAFAFTKLALPATYTPKAIESLPVNPMATQIARWLSSIGTSMSFGDLDDDGVANDICRVEPRTGEVLAAPAPGTGDRFTPFVVRPDPPLDPHVDVATGCKFGDFNEDGREDLLVAYVGRTPLLFLQRAPATAAPAIDGTSAAPPEHRPLAMASFRTVPLVAQDVPWWTSTVLQVDLDGDGHLDLVVGNYFPDGQVIFGEHASGPVTMHDSFSHARNGGTNRVYLWKSATSGDEPSVTYTEAPNPFPGDDATAWTLALGAADLDKDGLSELYVANDFGPDCLYLNRSKPGKLNLIQLHGRKGFATPTSFVLGNDSFKGMGIDFGDINGDGLFDLFVSNITEHGGLEESHFLFVSDGTTAGMDQGVAPWTDEAEERGVARSSWGWDTRFADFDNDGKLELMQATGFLKGDRRLNWWADLAEIANAHDMYVSDPRHWPAFPAGIDISGHAAEPFYTLADDGTFANVTTQVGFDGEWNARGIAIADVDRDGDLDVGLANQWEDSWFFRNDVTKHRSLGLALVFSAGATDTTVTDGTVTGERTWPAIGAFAEVKMPDGKVQIRQVDGGNGHSGANAQEVVFGLGDVPADTPLPVHLRWRDRTGHVRQTDLTVKPGWHTVTLATDGGAS